MAEAKQAKKQPVSKSDFLECESDLVFILMMTAAGYFGAFTYSIRGGVFCNAQTGNFVLLAMALGDGRWHHALYFIIPIGAYCLGTVCSEFFPKYVKRSKLIRWDTLLIMIEMSIVIVLGFIPEKAPVQITQVTINFICSMQYNTFRQAEGIPMATTFCTNHIRQVSLSIYNSIKHADERAWHLRKLKIHGLMLSFFVIGGIGATFFSNIFLGKAIWFALIPLGIVLICLLYADLVKEKGRLNQIPRGH